MHHCQIPVNHSMPSSKYRLDNEVEISQVNNMDTHPQVTGTVRKGDAVVVASLGKRREYT